MLVKPLSEEKIRKRYNLNFPTFIFFKSSDTLYQTNTLFLYFDLHDIKKVISKNTKLTYFMLVTRCSTRTYKNTPKNLRKSKEQTKVFHFILLQSSTLSVVSNLTFTLY